MNVQDQRWTTSTSGLKTNNAPIALNYSIPEAISTSSGSITLVDAYTIQVAHNPPLIIPDGCCADLVVASYPYSQPNVANSAAGLQLIPMGNNRMSVNFNGGGYVSASEVLIATGLYAVSDIMAAWNAFAITAGWVPASAASQNLFTLTGVTATQQLVITVDPMALSGGVFPASGIILNFTNPSPYSGLNDSIGELLGFPTTGSGAILTVAGGGDTPVSFTSPAAADFAATSAYSLYWSPVTGTYQNGQTGNLLYSFPLGSSSPNTVVQFQSSLRYPVQVTSGNFSSVRIWTTDQNGNKLPLKYYQAPFTFSVVISKNKYDGSI